MSDEFPGCSHSGLAYRHEGQAEFVGWQCTLCGAWPWPLKRETFEQTEIFLYRVVDFKVEASEYHDGYYATAVLDNGWFVQRHGYSPEEAEQNLNEYIFQGGFDKDRNS